MVPVGVFTTTVVWERGRRWGIQPLPRGSVGDAIAGAPAVDGVTASTGPLLESDGLLPGGQPVASCSATAFPSRRGPATGTDIGGTGPRGRG